ncbi:hypothetical protein CA11_28190 [Gimesia maris]|nr:hypothetical protein CA11_28190 [Gimesia maris]
MCPNVCYLCVRSLHSPPVKSIATPEQLKEGVSPNKIRAERSEQEVAIQANESSWRTGLTVSERVRIDSSTDSSHTATSRCLRQHRIAFGATPEVDQE